MNQLIELERRNRELLAAIKEFLEATRVFAATAAVRDVDESDLESFVDWANAGDRLAAAYKALHDIEASVS